MSRFTLLRLLWRIVLREQGHKRRAKSKTVAVLQFHGERESELVKR
jgi:hypothetical protein